MNLRLQAAIANYLVAAGILGTFLGLSAGISRAQVGLTSGDDIQTQRALGDLLQGAGLAFWTSVVGLTASILVSWAEKIALRGLDRDVGRFNTALEKVLVRATPEQLTVALLAEAEKQTAQLERFNTELAVSIANALEERVGGMLSAKLDGLLHGLDDLKTQQARVADETLREVTASVSGAMTSAAGTEMREMAATLAGVTSALKGAATALTAGHVELKATTDATLRQLVDAAERSSSSMTGGAASAIEAILARLEAAADQTAASLVSAGGQTAESMSSAARSLDSGAGRMTEVNSAFEQLTERQRELAEVVTGVLRQAEAAGQDLARSTAPLAAALSALRSSADVVSSGLSELRSLAGALSETTRHFEASQQKTADTWSSYETRFREVDEALGKCVNALVDGVQDLSAQSGAFMAELDQQMGKAVAGLAGVAKELSDTADDLLQSRGGVA